MLPYCNTSTYPPFLCVTSLPLYCWSPQRMGHCFVHHIQRSEMILLSIGEVHRGMLVLTLGKSRFARAGLSLDDTAIAVLHQ